MDRCRYQDTICALASPPGMGAVAVVRCSGPDARAICQRLLRRGDGRPLTLVSHRIAPAVLVDPETGRPIDEVLAFLMERPRSFTREDVVEIHCHGSPLQTRRVLALLVRSGMRPAEPGEFTRRAFLNGRLGLAEAEAINDLVHAASESAADAALDQLHGSLRQLVSRLRGRLVDLIALVEANLDFPEEDIDLLDHETVATGVAGIREEIDALASSYERGRLLRQGIRVLIGGRPNVGKSSLFNMIMKSERAIVTDIPGTTRDTIEESFLHRGVLFTVIDSAGLRRTDEPVETIGVRRTLELMARVDLVLYLVDLSGPAHPEDRELLASADAGRHQLVLTKADLPRALEPEWEDAHGRFRPVCLSSATGAGLDRLLHEMQRRAAEELTPRGRDVLITSDRHRECLARATEALGRFVGAHAAGTPLDVATVDLYEASDALGQIVGEVVTEDILDRIFERFCIGK
ncbi:MAG: tRNA uridine-5-carboxymethylaminomethyl(34) synthesis GTPase MnmE [Candidatus Riflebacteria bacterium]|nr:tRNA uridine-5-carboxymethylaminomethyl(34) synthesis GTPase MnmE [Candidatus Riflebacteria bacterium]